MIANKTKSRKRKVMKGWLALWTSSNHHLQDVSNWENNLVENAGGYSHSKLCSGPPGTHGWGHGRGHPTFSYGCLTPKWSQDHVLGNANGDHTWLEVHVFLLSSLIRMIQTAFRDTPKHHVTYQTHTSSGILSRMPSYLPTHLPLHRPFCCLTRDPVWAWPQLGKQRENTIE